MKPEPVHSVIKLSKAFTIIFLLVFTGTVACYEAGSVSENAQSGKTQSVKKEPGKIEPRAVYVLLDTSGSYGVEIEQVHASLRLLLKTLGAGESLALARIDSASFSEKDIVARMTFDVRPSMANSQKRAFLQIINALGKDIRPGTKTDITGGALQAIEYLNETGARNKYIILFSDLKEETRSDHARDFPIKFNGMKVFAMNASDLNSTRGMDSRKKRQTYWQGKVEQGSGLWAVVNDTDKLVTLFE